MPVSNTYTRFSSIVPAGGADLRLSELGMSSDGGTSQAGIVSIASTVAPSTGSLTDLHDLNLATEAHWASGGGMPVITILSANTIGLEVFTHVRQGSGSVVGEQIASATIEVSTDEASWTTVHSGPISAAGAVSSHAAWTSLAVDIGESVVDVASAVEGFEDNLFFLEDSGAGADAVGSQLAANVAQADSVAAAGTIAAAFGPQATDVAASNDGIESTVFTMYVEAIRTTDGLAVGATTTAGLVDGATMLDVIQQAINQLVVDSANGADGLNLAAALVLVDVANAAAAQTPAYSGVMLVAELIAALEAYNGAGDYDIAELGALSDAYVARVDALASLLESAQTVETNTMQVRVVQTAVESASGAVAIASEGSLLNALLTDAVLAAVRINVGGELFTGWVLNADSLAPSEYQFTDLQFNSACRHGDIYLLAADDGIYQFTEDAGVETVMTYIKTGKTDFGSDMRKGVTDAYMVYSASGQMVLKVTISVGGALQTYEYVMAPFAAAETPEPQRVAVGKGLKSRYWQFELVGVDADCIFDEIGMLPVVLSRRI